MTSDRWSRIVEDADRREAARTGRLLNLREGLTPDTAARAAEIAPQLNADPSTVMQDLPAAEQIIRSAEAEESLRGAPGTREFITKAPVNAALASEDTGFLAGLERSYWDLDAQMREGAKEVFGWNRDDRFQGPVSRGLESATKFLFMVDQVLPGVAIGSQMRAANDALEIMDFIDNGGQLSEREGGFPEGYLRHGFVFDEVTGQMLSYDQATPEQRAAVKQRVMNELLEDNEDTAQIALQIAAVQATMPPGEQISMDNLPDALKFYATSGAVSSIPFLFASMIGGAPAAAGAGVAMGVGDIYIEGVGDQGAAAFTDDDLARNAMIAAPLYAATEFLGPFGRLVRKPFRNIPDELIMRALRTRGVPARIATAVGTSAFENAVSEMVQDMLVDAANGKLDFSEEGISSYLESGAAGALGGGPVTLALEGPGIVAQGMANREAQRDGQTADQLQQIQKQSEQANMRTAAPAQWREFMQSIGTENGKLYVEPDALDVAVNAGQVSLEQLGVDQSALEAAKEAGGRVEISQLEWGVNYAGTEAGQTLIDNASVRPDGLTPTQLRNFADVQAEIQQQAEADTQLQQEIDTVAAELEAQTRAQLRAAGRSPEVASAGAKAWTAMLSTAATRTKDVAVFDQFGVDVRSLPQQKAAQDIPTRTLEQGAPKVRGQMAADLPNQHQLMPHLRTKAIKIAADREAGKPLFTQKTNNKNADPQISAIDEVLSRHPRAGTSPQAWSSMMADALATTDVPAPPYAFLRDINGGGSVELLNRLTEGQIADADHGFANAAEFREAYINGEISIADTGKLFLWSFLSRGVSPYTQESLFIDAFEGIDQFIEAAADGTLDQKEYTEWAKTAAPKGSGQPGAGATHNLNAFGTLFLKKMSEDAGMGDGRSRLQVIHDMMMDPDSTGRDIRRQFLRMGEGVGIDNKVVSFTLLVAGFDDVMVLDRVQIRQLWNDGRFDGINLYDGYKTDGKPVTGSAISSLTYGARGLLVYEAIEEALKTRIDAIYEAVGRPEAASVGRYHWETWVASSQQEASHATIDAILANAKGEYQPLEGVTAKEGEYGSYAYGARYGVSALDGSGYFLYEVPDRGLFQFTVDQFQGFLTRIKKTSEGVVPNSKFKVTAAGNAPWFFQEGVSLDRLAAIAGEAGRAVTADQVSEADVVDGVDQTVSDGPAADQPGTARTFEQGDGRRGLTEGVQEDDPQGVRRAPTGREAIRGRQVDALGVYGSEDRPIVELANPEDFRQAITKTKAELGEVGAQVTVYDDYAGKRVFVMDDGLSGFALDGDDIISVFGHPDAPPGAVKSMFPVAAALGGRRLDAFDTYLPKVYERAGFKAVAKLGFSREFAPDGWDYDWFQTNMGGSDPNIVFMVYDPANASRDTDNVVEDYDAGIAAQQADAPQTFDQSGVERTFQQAEMDLLEPPGESKMVGPETLLVDEAELKVAESDNAPSFGNFRSLRYIAYEDGSPVGVLQIRTDGKRSKKAEIQHVYVASEGRGRGIAGDLLKRARQDFTVRHSDDLTDDGRAFKAKYPQTGARGQIAIPEVIGRGDFIIDLFASADESTFFHEMGHAGIEMLRFLSEQDGAPQQIKDDIAKVHEWMEQTTGEAVGDVYTTPQQEAWAEAFENYLMEGKAPTPTLKTVFVKLRRWLTRLYQTAQGAGTVPSPEIKRVMDRLLATDQQIEAAKLQDGDVELFREQPPFMSKDEWETYKRVAERGDAEAEGRALSVAMEAVRKRRSKEWKEAYKAALPEELAALQEQQEYVLLDALGNQDPAGGGFFGLGARLDRATLIDMVGEAALPELNNKRLKTKHNIFVKDGADPEQVAEMFGFRNGAHMINALRSIKPINEQARLNAEARANEIVPNLTPAEMQEEAQVALKNPQKIERTAREGAALARAGGSGTTSWQQMNAAAYTRAVELVGAMNVRTAGNYDQFRVAARKAAREAQAELAKVVRLADGTPAPGGVTALNAAAAAKRRQLVNEHMYTVAREQAVKFDKARTRFRKLGTVKEAKKHTPEVYDQIEQLLDQYDFRIVSAKDVAQRAAERVSLTAFEETLVENGTAGELTIPMSVRLRAQKTHYTELTVDDLDAVVDAIDSLSHLGKSTNKAYQEADAKLYADQVAEIALNSRMVMKGKRLPERESTQRSIVPQMIGQLNHHIEQATTTLRRMDGFMGAGPAIRYIKRPLDKAAAALELRKEQVANEVKDTFSTHYTRAQMRKLNTKKIHSNELGLSLTKAGWLSMALNTGNEGNFQRLTDPDARTGTYDARKVNDALKGILDENDWRFVQSVWDHIDSYWPEIKKLEREVTGVTPNKIDAALQVDAPDFVTGGYYPIRYDRDLNLGSILNGADDAYRDAVTGRYGKAQTRHGHTEARLRSTGKALDLSLGAYEDHLQQVVHDLELRKPVNNAMKLLNNPEIGAVLAEHGRPGELEQLKLWVRDTAAGDQITAEGLLAMASRASRKALTVKYIGWKLSTTLIQPLGVAQAGVVVGNRKLLNGYMKYVGRITQWDEFVKSKSDHMRGRIRVMNREINEFRNEAKRGSAILDGKLGRFTNAMIVYGFVPMQQMQYWTVDLPVFVAVYEDMRAKGFSEEDAIHEAESAVDRASGSALLTNRASFERGTAGHSVTRSEYVKQFTMLSSYVHAKYNATSEVVGSTDFSDPKQAAMFVASMMQLYVLEIAILTLLRGLGDEEKEEELGTVGHWARVFGAEALGTHPVTRPASSMVRGYGVGGVPLGDMTELMGRGAGSAFDLAIGDGDMEDILRAFDAAATPFMLPTGQIKEVIRAITADDPGVQMGRAALGLPVARE